MPQYAQKISSTESTKDGLYWLTTEGEPQSPLGELFARAARDTGPVRAGPVHEQDLGPVTARIARALETYDPDGTWMKVSEDGANPRSTASEP